jgi:hypothetical protein
MWNVLLGFLIGHTPGVSRYVRALLAVIAVGVLIAGLIYAVVVMQAVSERSRASHVPTHRTN